MEANVWYQEGDFLYLLQETGTYRKGQAQLENKFLINIQGAGSKEEKEALAEKIFKLLNNA